MISPSVHGRPPSVLEIPTWNKTRNHGHDPESRLHLFLRGRLLRLRLLRLCRSRVLVLVDSVDNDGGDGEHAGNYQQDKGCGQQDENQAQNDEDGDKDTDRGVLAASLVPPRVEVFRYLLQAAKALPEAQSFETSMHIKFESVNQLNFNSIACVVLAQCDFTNTSSVVTHSVLFLNSRPQGVGEHSCPPPTPSTHQSLSHEWHGSRPSALPNGSAHVLRAVLSRLVVIIRRHDSFVTSFVLSRLVLFSFFMISEATRPSSTSSPSSPSSSFVFSYFFSSSLSSSFFFFGSQPPPSEKSRLSRRFQYYLQLVKIRELLTSNAQNERRTHKIRIGKE